MNEDKSKNRSTHLVVKGSRVRVMISFVFHFNLKVKVSVVVGVGFTRKVSPDNGS